MTRRPQEDAWALPNKRDRFGLRTRRIHSPTVLRDVADRLRQLADERETGPARAYVEAALRCPYWGVRVLAIRTIAAWGGRQNKAWLMARAERRTLTGRHTNRTQRWDTVETLAARGALRPLLTVADGAWLLDAWFRDAGRRFEALGTGILTDAVIEARLMEEARSADAERRLAVLRLIATRRGLGCGATIARLLEADPDHEVQRFAKMLARWIASASAGR